MIERVFLDRHIQNARAHDTHHMHKKPKSDLIFLIIFKNFSLKFYIIIIDSADDEMCVNEFTPPQNDINSCLLVSSWSTK